MVNSPPPARLCVIQPYVPQYRFPLFTRLDMLLGSLGIRFVVAAGRPQGADAARSDAVASAAWLRQLDHSSMRVAGRTLQRRTISPVLTDFRPTHVIVEQALHNLDTYEVGAWARRHRAQVAMWGHGRTYTAPTSRLQEGLKVRLTRRASWFFAYTEGGSEYLQDRGFRGDRITVLRNSTDTTTLRQELAAASDPEVEAFQMRLGVAPGCAALFLGGLDDRKGIPFLLEASRLVAERVPGFVLMLGGDGDLGPRLRHEESQGAPIRVLGRLDGHQRAVAMRAASLMMIPEWVGLVAVDALTAGLPIVTTTHPRHAPEFEYLHPGSNAVITPHEASAYASAVADLLADPRRLSLLAAQGVEDANRLSIEGMADSFVDGITRWIRSPR